MKFTIITLLIISVCGISNISAQSNDSIIQYYTELIAEAAQRITTHVFPTDAKSFEAPEEPIKEYDDGSYDFVIIGAGVTGCALANRLSEIGQWNILLIEAGNFSDNGIVKIPNLFIYNLFSDYNWAFQTVPQTTACLGITNQTCRVSRGKGVGGTTLINSLQYVRANPENYNQWAKSLRDSSWSYESILKYFKKSEHFHWTNPKAPVDLKYHGNDGLLQVQNRLPDYPLNDIFIEANKQLGYDITDYNSPRQIGGCISQLYTKNGTRHDMGTAYITPFLDRPNLKVITNSYVTKIEIDETTKTATGVLFANEGTTYRVRARKEIILSAGAINSPQILMLSGIGPKEHLQDLDIDVIEDLQVGSHSKDHTLSHLFLFSSNLTIPEEPLVQQLEEYLNGYGPLTSAGTQAQGIGFYNVNCKKCNVANVAIFSDYRNVSVVEQALTGYNDETIEAFTKTEISNAIRFNLLYLNPKSFGTIRLKSKNPFDYPLIDPMMLSDSGDEDIRSMYLGIKQIFRIAQTQSYRSINLTYAGEPLPACSDYTFKSKDYWYCFLRQTTVTGYHPMSTCPMGISKNTGSVVDTNLKVHGVKKLRVADASVFPTTISGYPSMVCLMIGEKISDVIKAEYL